MPVPQLEDLARDHAAVNHLPVEAIPALRGKLAELDTLLLARLMSSTNGQGQKQQEEDRSLKVEEAAPMLGHEPDWLYHHIQEFQELGIATKVHGRWVLSLQRINKYLRQNRGR